MRPIKTIAAAAAAAPKPLMVSPPRSQWHSLVSYLFSGLSAMLALIAFALLILACSYRAVSARFDNNNDGGGGDDSEDDSNNQVKVYNDKILVIMAGELTPTFLATPVFSKASNFGDQNGDSKRDMQGSTENDEKMKQEMDDGHHQLPTITHNHDRQQPTQHQN
ncbi:Protein GLUTAMINE DUMPER 4 [Hibiscus syriacus]|uniref:Protein GLUTAMINE DUMPER 4 n=1 Tax=Hibiscus syriacus TaxID=106335 RepID=A0A6A3D0V2_HIBSY|nr:protein GLUTAMINE DUMPER 5-like [Hibiscus syriacus]KAE8735200.1 Protein GLUTAMINE DUMPER 4 [Hibiscus syriacus]